MRCRSQSLNSFAFSIETAVLFADISGFTSISETLDGTIDGIEDLVRIVSVVIILIHIHSAFLTTDDSTDFCS